MNGRREFIMYAVERRVSEKAAAIGLHATNLHTRMGGYEVSLWLSYPTPDDVQKIEQAIKSIDGFTLTESTPTPSRNNGDGHLFGVYFENEPHIVWE